MSTQHSAWLEKQALNKAHGSEASGSFGKGRNRKEGTVDTGRDGEINGSKNEERRNAASSEGGRERDEGGRRGHGCHNEREGDGLHIDGRNERRDPHDEDRRGRDGPRIVESQGGATNTDLESPHQKRRRKRSPDQILRYLDTPKTPSSAYSVSVSFSNAKCQSASYRPRTLYHG